MLQYDGNLIGKFEIPLLSMNAITLVAPELTFENAVQVSTGQNFVYLLVDDKGLVHYPGKTNDADPRKRFRGYKKWFQDHLKQVVPVEDYSPLRDPLNTPDPLIWTAPIVRWSADNRLDIMAANVDGTDGVAREWEARVQALAALLTGNESLIGGSAWEMKPDTLRYQARVWVLDRLTELRLAGAL